MNSEKRIIVFCLLMFEEFFPFSMNYFQNIQTAKNKNYLEKNKNLEEYADLSLLLYEELRISPYKRKNHQIIQVKKTNCSSQLLQFKEYFYFILKTLLKNEIKQKSPLSPRESKIIKNIIEKNGFINNKSQNLAIRKCFEFSLLNFNYEKINILQ